jgi:hypothetical protein
MVSNTGANEYPPSQFTLRTSVREFYNWFEATLKEAQFKGIETDEGLQGLWLEHTGLFYFEGYENRVFVMGNTINSRPLPPERSKAGTIYVLGAQASDMDKLSHERTGRRQIISYYVKPTNLDTELHIQATLLAPNHADLYESLFVAIRAEHRVLDPALTHASPRREAGANLLPENVWLFVEHEYKQRSLPDLYEEYLQLRGIANRPLPSDNTRDQNLDTMKKAIKGLRKAQLKRGELII